MSLTERFAGIFKKYNEGGHLVGQNYYELLALYKNQLLGTSVGCDCPCHCSAGCSDDPVGDSSESMRFSYGHDRRCDDADAEKCAGIRENFPKEMT